MFKYGVNYLMRIVFQSCHFLDFEISVLKCGFANF